MSTLRWLPTWLTGLRLALVLPLWGLALLGMQRALAVGLMVALLTDLLDGYAARRLGVASEASSRFDSLADKVLTLSVLSWLLLLHPTIVREHPVLAGAVLLLALASWLVGLLRHGRVTDLHLPVAKLAGAAQGLFVLHTFWAGSYSPPLLFVAAGLWCLAAGAEIWAQLRVPARSGVDASADSAAARWD